MERLGDFKLLFIAESLYGLSSVSLSDLTQSTLKKVYCLVLLLLNIFVCLLYFSKVTYQKEGNVYVNYLAMYQIFTCIMSVCVMLFALFDNKTKLSAAMNLEAIKKMLKAQGTNRFMKLVKGVILLGLQGIVLSAIYYNMKTLNHLTLVEPKLEGIVFRVLNYGVRILLCYGCLEYITTCYTIRKEIYLDLTFLNTISRESLGTDTPETIIGRTIPCSEVESEEQIRKLIILKKAQGALYNTEQDIQSWYLIFMGWFVIIASILFPLNLPSIWFSELKVTPFLSSAIPSTVITIVLVTGWEQVKDEQYKTGLEWAKLLQNCKGEQHQQNIKHQLLASYHRSPNYSCFIFDIDYPLLATIVDTAFMILCAMLSK